jgi:hypothetical protein
MAAAICRVDNTQLVRQGFPIANLLKDERDSLDVLMVENASRFSTLRMTHYNSRRVGNAQLAHHGFPKRQPAQG